MIWLDQFRELGHPLQHRLDRFPTISPLRHVVGKMWNHDASQPSHAGYVSTKSNERIEIMSPICPKREVILKTSPRLLVGSPAFRQPEFALLFCRQQTEIGDSMVETSGTGRGKSGL